jgi:hypothetical protein
MWTDTRTAADTATMGRAIAARDQDEQDQFDAIAIRNSHDPPLPALESPATADRTPRRTADVGEL